jgi:hypothetical protein
MMLRSAISIFIARDLMSWEVRSVDPVLPVRWQGLTFIGCQDHGNELGGYVVEKTLRSGIKENHALSAMKDLRDRMKFDFQIKDMRKFNSNMTTSFCRQMIC